MTLWTFMISMIIRMPRGAVCEKVPELSLLCPRCQLCYTPILMADVHYMRWYLPFIHLQSHSAPAHLHPLLSQLYYLRAVLSHPLLHSILSCGQNKFSYFQKSLWALPSFFSRAPSFFARAPSFFARFFDSLILGFSQAWKFHSFPGSNSMNLKLALVSDSQAKAVYGIS